ncbi:CLUMA_CG001516, isoform A [Clunio marinus]|uniref:CLUMA_CG001516, isoform A n=1 Tax=Clunio marinus TaxID=568069 RepID=A0A1J1HMN5_9DIPT|nr:CLUMA_CG001516, isoform A [Clunio marinus]
MHERIMQENHCDDFMQRKLKKRRRQHQVSQGCDIEMNIFNPVITDEMLPSLMMLQHISNFYCTLPLLALEMSVIATAGIMHHFISLSSALWVQYHHTRL